MIAENVKPRRSTAGSAVLVMSASIVSALLGFGREVVSAHFYGTSPAMDAFLNASTIPTLLINVFNGALLSALVPTFAEYMSAGKLDDVRKLGSTVLNALFLALVGFSILGWFLAPVFVPVVAHGFPAPEQRLVVEMVRWLLPGIIAATLGGVATALLNAHSRFMASAFVWVATNLVTILFVIAFHGRFGIFALVLGSVIGLFAQLVVQVPSLLRYRLYNFTLNLNQPGIAKVWSLLGPVALGSCAVQVNLAFDRFFASTLPSGSTAGIGYTTKLVFLPIPIVAGAIATVTFPLIARQFAGANRDGVQHSVSLALRMVSFVSIPCAVGLTVLAHPIVQTLFQRGAFTARATDFCASLVPFACLPLLMTSYNTVLGRACYACKEVRFAVTGSILTVILNVALSWTLLPILGARGLLLANGVAGLFLSTFLIFVLRRLTGGFDWNALFASLGRVALASSVMAAAIVGTQWFGYVPGSTLARAAYLLLLVSLGAVAFVGSAYLLKVDELTIATNTLRQRLSHPPSGS